MPNPPRRLAALLLPLTLLPLALAPAAAHADNPVPAVDPTAGAALPRDDYRGGVQVVRGKPDDPNLIKGTVFADANRNSVKDAGEKGVPNVVVSNGREVVRTDAAGNYRLPAFDRMTVFVTQPAGYAVPVNDRNLAQFFYHHFPNGSPALKYGGLPRTGPLPQAVNFPMVTSAATAKANQNCAIAADIQAYNQTQVDYARKGAIGDIVARNDLGGCGVLLLGDNVGDNLSLNGAIKDSFAKAQGPVRVLAGNHDENYDAKNDDASLDTFRRDFGPTYFSYDAGRAHFVALDDIEYNGAKPGGKDGGAREHLTTGQLEWLKKDLATVPRDALVVIYAHAPFVFHRGVIVDNSADVFAALTAAGRTAENTLLVGGHTHTLENLRPGTKRAEYASIGALPFHQIVSGTVSGDWYSGSKDADGLPQAYGSDGQRPGHLNIGLAGNRYVESYRVRRQPWTTRLSLGVNTPTWRAWAEKALTWRDAKPRRGQMPPAPDATLIPAADLRGGTWLTANFYAGSREAKVTVAIDGGKPAPAEHTQPGTGEGLRVGWEFSDVPAATSNLKADGNVTRNSSSLWRFALPGTLAKGQHTAEVTGVDRFGRGYHGTLRFTVG